MNAITRFGGLTFAGKVSGEGGLFIWGNAEWDGSKYKHPYLSLTNPENDFTMGVKCQYGGLRLWKDGALPTTAPVELDREGEVVFDELSVPFANLPQDEAFEVLKQEILASAPETDGK